jgi:hypothetical protein
MDKMEIESFLKQITGINKRYEEIARATGENFNVFNVLRLTRKELIHSEFLATLLDPEGVHEKGNIFIKLFFEILRNAYPDVAQDFPCEDLRVNRELPIRFNHKYKMGGNIDIVITDRISQKQIFIENKIDSGDEPKQLIRYHEENQDAIIIYLTLDGHPPSNDSTGDGQVKYIGISYRDHILKWLDLCKKETVDNPFLRETINQYILLIKQLTGQARSKEMSDEILRCITKDEESMIAYLSIKDIDPRAVFEYVINDKVASDLESSASKRGLKFEMNPNGSDILEIEFGFRFFKKEWGNFDIFFAFAGNLNGLGFGVFCGDKWLSSSTNMEKYANWNWKNGGWDVLKLLYHSDNDVIKEIDKKVAELVPIIEGIKATDKA